MSNDLTFKDAFVTDRAHKGQRIHQSFFDRLALQINLSARQFCPECGSHILEPDSVDWAKAMKGFEVVTLTHLSRINFARQYNRGLICEDCFSAEEVMYRLAQEAEDDEPDGYQKFMMGTQWIKVKADPSLPPNVAFLIQNGVRVGKIKL
jgi:hypothetical protein